MGKSLSFGLGIGLGIALTAGFLAGAPIAWEWLCDHSTAAKRFDKRMYHAVH